MVACAWLCVAASLGSSSMSSPEKPKLKDMVRLIGDRILGGELRLAGRRDVHVKVQFSCVWLIDKAKMVVHG
jgi:hypothetical protein